MIAWVLRRLHVLDGPVLDPDTEAFRDLLREQREAAERETQRLRSLRSGNPLANRVRGPQGAHPPAGDASV